MTNSFEKQLMKVTFTCKFCSGVVFEETAPQDEAMKMMNGSSTKVHMKSFKDAFGRRTFQQRGGAPVVMGRTISKDLFCPHCHIAVVVPTGMARGVYGSHSVTSLGGGGGDEKDDHVPHRPRAARPTELEPVIDEPEFIPYDVERVVSGAFSMPREVNLEAGKGMPKSGVSFPAFGKVGE